MIYEWGDYNMTNGTISEKCEELYNKLNSFVTSVINRDVTPQINNLQTGKADTEHTHSSMDVIERNTLPNLGIQDTATQSRVNLGVNAMVGSLSTSITNLVQVQEVAVNMGTIASGSSVTKTATVTACPTGYSSMILVKSTSWCICSLSSVTGTTLTLTGMNLHSGSHTCWISVYVVYYPSTWNI